MARAQTVIPRSLALLVGGEDYELAFAAAPEQAEAVAALAERLALPITRVGALEAGRGVKLVDESGAEVRLDSTGWTHF